MKYPFATLKASQLIAKLARAIEEHGDLEVAAGIDAHGAEIYVAGQDSRRGDKPISMDITGHPISGGPYKPIEMPDGSKVLSVIVDDRFTMYALDGDDKVHLLD